MAFIVLRPQFVSSWKGRHDDFEKELKAHAKQSLPGFACPEWVKVVQELPVSFLYREYNVSPMLGSTENVNWENFEKRIAKYCSQALGASYIFLMNKWHI